MIPPVVDQAWLEAHPEVVVADVRSYLDGRSGADAYAKIRAGASAVQLYSALVFEGPSLIGRIRTDLAERLKADGFTHVREAIGAA